MIMKYKHAKTVSERQDQNEDYLTLYNDRPYLNINEWTVNEVETEAQQLGLSGSPTKVKKIENIVLQAKESKAVQPTDADINLLMKELMDSHTLG